MKHNRIARPLPRHVLEAAEDPCPCPLQAERPPMKLRLLLGLLGLALLAELLFFTWLGSF